MKSMVTPFALSCAMMRKRSSVSLAERLEVGSSMMRSLALVETALQISTICWWPMPSLPTFIRGSKRRPRSSSSRAAASTMAATSVTMVPCTSLISRPRKMFSATVRWGMRFNSW